MIGESYNPQKKKFQNFYLLHFRAVIVHTRLTIFYPKRILANVFISLGCFPPNPNWSWEETIKKYHEEVGYDVFGYWEFHAADDTPELVAMHVRIDRVAQVDCL